MVIVRVLREVCEWQSMSTARLTRSHYRLSQQPVGLRLSIVKVALKNTIKNASDKIKMRHIEF